MREDEFPEETVSRRNEARSKAIEAAQELWDSYAAADDDFSATVVTGVVLIAEGVLPSGFPSIAWLAGNGQPPGSDGVTGLARHRIDGMCRHVIRESYDSEAGAHE